MLVRSFNALAARAFAAGDPAGLDKRLTSHGWVVLPGIGAAGLDAVVAALDAAVLQTTEVVVREGRALVTSDRALDLHTDHHRADFIAWHCRAQTSAGGATRLADAAAAFATLTTSEQRLLGEVRLFEHSIFAGDATTHPVVEHGADGPRFYCSFWFDDEGALSPPQRSAFAAFESAIRRQEVANFRLVAGDVLLINNRRILHGRTAITGSRDRHLDRYWLTRS